jgi:hypothetical protein
MRRTVILAALICAILAPAARAGVSAVVVDCQAHSRLTRSYSLTELSNAIATMPAETAEYTDCYDVIQRALLAAQGKLALANTGAGGSGGSFLPTPVIVALVVLALGAASFGALALRRRAGAGERDDDPGASQGPPAP